VQRCDNLRYNVTAVVLKQHDVLSIQGSCSLLILICTMFKLAVTTNTCVCESSLVSLTAVSTAAAVSVILPQAVRTQLRCIRVCRL
jgi:hypothetical protein